MDESGIRVRTGELYRFAEGVRFGTVSAFAPAVAALSVPLRMGAPFGHRLAEVSDDTRAATERYAAVVDAALANLQRFAQAAEVLAGAVEQIAADLDAADERAAAALAASS